MENNFIDYVKILCRSGKGGSGSLHLRHLKYQPNGGPDGGDGGRGGHVYLRGNHNVWTLLHLKYNRHIFAGDGGNGGKERMHGEDGQDVYIDVPCGTVAYDALTGRYVCDVKEDGQEVLLLEGGRGGLGNYQFRTSTRQTPRFAQSGEPMREMLVVLELKLLADVGLVGFPNAGKSTLMSVVSNAHPKVANYPFTTMQPSLGIVPYRGNRSFVMADIPGIIEGAAEGKGLGLRFLRHIERNSLLLFLVPGDTQDISREYNILLNELAKFNPDLLEKHRVLAITKCDLLDDELIRLLRPTLPTDLPCVFISSVAEMGLNELKDILWEELNRQSNKMQTVISEETLVHRDKDTDRLAMELREEGEADDIYIPSTDDDDQLISYTCFPGEVTAFTTKRTLARDYRRISHILNIDEEFIIAPHQTHSDHILHITPTLLSLDPTERQDALEGIDAVYTTVKGVIVGVSTADCVPILLYDPRNHAVAAVHAGWRGTVSRILQKTISSMIHTLSTRPQELIVLIGPHISTDRYEVGYELYQMFKQTGFPMTQIAKREEKWHIDLGRANEFLLIESGVAEENIHHNSLCTFDNADILFSARREQTSQEKCGRNFNGIFINK